MPIAILTFDLHGEEPEVRRRLGDKLIERRYKRVFAGRAFAKRYEETEHIESVVSGIEDDFRRVAAATGANGYSIKVFTRET